jgi:hypothetical protein
MDTPRPPSRQVFFNHSRGMNTASNNEAVNMFQNATNAVNTLASNVATAANNIATNVSRNVGNLTANLASSANSVASNNGSSGGSGLLGVLLLGLFILAGIWVYMWWSGKTGKAEKEKEAEARPELPTMAPGAGASAVPAGPVVGKETWCFVGEDMTGRWCVRVPSASACVAERSFSTRSDCELVNASKLPLGVVGGAGTTMAPLAPNMPAASLARTGAAN